MKTSIFDLFKIGIGPSSSHTVGPMRAARRFLLDVGDNLPRVTRVLAELYGSLALTGIGHGTDRAILLGLAGEQAETVDTSQIDNILQSIRESKSLRLLGTHAVPFNEPDDLMFHPAECLPGHPNGMCFSAFDEQKFLLLQEVFYSIGGGFIVKEGEHEPDAAPLPVPHPFSNGAELLEEADSKKLCVWEVMLENESALRSEPEVRERVRRIWSVM